MTKKQIFFHPQRFFLDNIPKQRDGECYVLNAEYGELWAAYGEQEQEIERLKAALRILTNGNKYSTEVCNIARGTLAQSDHEPSCNAGDSNARTTTLVSNQAHTQAVESGDQPNPVPPLPEGSDQQQPTTHARLMFRSYPAAFTVAGVIRSRLFQQFREQGFWHARSVDLVWRYNGLDVREEADWLKDLWYAIRGCDEASSERTTSDAP